MFWLFSLIDSTSETQFESTWCIPRFLHFFKHCCTFWGFGIPAGDPEAEDLQRGLMVDPWVMWRQPGVVKWGLSGGFKYFFCSPLPGEMIQFKWLATHIFQLGWNHQLVVCWWLMHGSPFKIDGLKLNTPNLKRKVIWTKPPMTLGSMMFFDVHVPGFFRGFGVNFDKITIIA